MMTDREKLVELLEASTYEALGGNLVVRDFATVKEFADHLIANGVTVRPDAKKLVCEITIDNEKILRELMDETELDGKTLSEWIELLKGYKHLERERDAAVKDLKAACKLLWVDDSMQCCNFCEHENDPKDTGYCDKCNNGNRFKFKPAALCPENTKEDNA